MEGRGRVLRSGTSSPVTLPTASCPVPRGPPGTVAAAAWIESKVPGSGSRTWPTCSPTTTLTALELAQAAGHEASRRTELESPARRFLGLAGERALGLDTGRGRWRASSGRWPSPRPATPTGLARSPASARPPCRPDAPWRRPRRARGGDRVLPGERRGRRRPLGRWARSASCCSGSGIRAGWSYLRRRSRCWSRCRPASSSLGALTELASVEALQGRGEAGLRYAEQALALG